MPIDWSVRGPQGPAGVFSGTFTSPNGAYSISVTDAGIVLTAPGASVRPAGNDVTIHGNGSILVESDGPVTVRGASTLVSAAASNELRGAVVLVNGRLLP